MHELSIAEDLLAIVEKTAAEHQLVRVARLRIVVGALGNVVPEALEFALEVAGRGTVADGAQLEIIEVPVTVRCTECGTETELEDIAFVCSACGSVNVDVVRGSELYLDSIEGDTDLEEKAVND
ncbi:MAG: hydrogenase maturation nickel metallochaperone HypA [Verrucomicrobia bacterium]|nr:hydrogenase maturation nickel metallochaperone HypA [Verrucomicrobiota bacterium]